MTNCIKGAKFSLVDCVGPGNLFEEIESGIVVLVVAELVVVGVRQVQRMYLPMEFFIRVQ